MVDVGKGEGCIDTNVNVAIDKRRKEAQGRRRSKSSEAKPKTTTSKKHIALKRKVFGGCGPIKESLKEKELGSSSKKRKLQRRTNLVKEREK